MKFHLTVVGHTLDTSNASSMPSPESGVVVRMRHFWTLSIGVVSVFHLLALTAYFGGVAKEEINNSGWLATTP